MADAATISVLLQAKDQASAQIDKVRGSMGRLGESFGRHRKAMGLAATGISAGLAGIAVSFTKSAEEQRKTIRGLDTSLKTIGMSYEANKDEIEALFAAQQKQTNFGDEESRASLSRLITMTGDYEGSMKALVIAQDIAAASGKSADGVVKALGQVMNGTTTALKAYGIEAEKGESATSVLERAAAKYTGQAIAQFDAMTQLNQTFDDLKDAIGTIMLDKMSGWLEKADDMLRIVVDWVEQNPKLAKTLLTVVAAVTAFLAVAGPLLLIIPLLAANFAILSTAMAPITIALVGIAFAVTAGIKIWQNWDRIMSVIQVSLAGVWRAAIGLGRGLLVAAKAVATFLGKGEFAASLQKDIDMLDRMQESAVKWAAGSEDNAKQVIKSSEKVTIAHQEMAKRHGIHMNDMDEASQERFEKEKTRLAEEVKLANEAQKTTNELLKVYHKRQLDEGVAHRAAVLQADKDLVDNRLAAMKEANKLKLEEQDKLDKEILERAIKQRLAQAIIDQQEAEDDAPLTAQSFQDAFAAGTGQLGGMPAWVRGAGQSERDAAIARFQSITLPPMQKRMQIHQDRIARGMREGRADFIRDGTANLEATRAWIERERIRVYGAAAGGIVPMGGANVLVGERGPEMVSLPGASQVHPSGSGQVNNFHFNGPVYGVDELREVVVEAVRDHAIAGGFVGVFGQA